MIKSEKSCICSFYFKWWRSEFKSLVLLWKIGRSFRLHTSEATDYFFFFHKWPPNSVPVKQNLTTNISAVKFGDFFSRDRNWEPVPNCPIRWNHMPPSLSIPFIDATFFWQLCIVKQWHQSRVYADENWQQGVMANMRKLSTEWFNFTIKDENSASYNDCKIMISSASGDTSHMLKHLSMQHGLEFQECHVFDTRRRAAASRPSSTCYQR